MINDMNDFQKLILKGYCVVSRKFGHLARIDRPDWLESLPENIGKKGDLNKLTDKQLRSAADHYRRVHSKDIKIIPVNQLKRFEKSQDGPTVYLK